MKLRTLPVRFVSSLVLLTALSGHASAVERLLKIPDGYGAGLATATYGTYGSVVGTSARSLQARLENLENKVLGLSKLANEDRIQQSEIIFTLETAIIRLNLDIANAPSGQITAFERSSMLYSTARLYQNVRFSGERIFEDMVRFIDVKLPGPNGLQLRSELDGTLESLYLPNYRTDKVLTDAERASLYQQKVAEFKAKGGSLEEMKKLTPELIEAMGPYTRVEYVVRGNDEIWVSEGNAGHILLAAGGQTKSGGQMIFVRDGKGEFSMLIVSNSSGSFKPDIKSAYSVSQRVAGLIGIDPSQVIVTKGEPVNTQPVKVYAKALGIAKDVTDARLARLNQMEDRLKKYSPLAGVAPKSCRAVFGGKSSARGGVLND